METHAFRVPLRVQPTDIDNLGHVNNIVYLQWVQEAAAMHWSRLASETERADLAWVVMRHEIDYRQAALLGDALYALTWVGETAGVKSIRHVRIFREPETLLAEAKTTWVMVDARAQRPKRITPEIMEILTRKV